MQMRKVFPFQKFNTPGPRAERIHNFARTSFVIADQLDPTPGIKKALKGIFITVLCLSLLSAFLFPQGKKLRVVTEKANIYLDPDKASPIVETVVRGTTLSLKYMGKVRKVWNYIYYTTQGGITKSGYVLDSLVEKLFIPTKSGSISNSVANPSTSAEAKTHFRKTHWGMGKKALFAIEGKPKQQETANGLHIFAYEQTVLGMNCTVGYIFVENKLTSAKYNFLENYSNKNLHIENYEKIKSLLTQKYGSPDRDKTTWRNDLYKDDVSKKGLAVSLGHLEYISEWQTPETVIILALLGRNNEVTLEVEYMGMQQKDLQEKAEEKALLDPW